MMGLPEKLPDCNLAVTPVHGHTAAPRKAARLPTRLTMMAPAGHQGGSRPGDDRANRAGERESDHGE
jgi:hypothetical protein